MGRDSFFGDRVVWTGRPKLVHLPPLYFWGAIACAVIAATMTLSALFVSLAIQVPVSGMMLFALWMATIGLAFWRLPLWWRSEQEYIITEKHIVVRRGRYRRFMERSEISFARIHWHRTVSDVGDLELVRAVPTGALRRRITLTLTGVAAPDRVWAFVRGVTPAAPAGDGHRLLAQRLDEGERVLWSSHPASHWTRFFPHGARAILSLLLGLFLVTSAFVMLAHPIAAIRSVLKAGLEPASPSFVAFATSIALSFFMLSATAFGVLYATVVRPVRLERLTRYLITDRRVLIQRPPEDKPPGCQQDVGVDETAAHQSLPGLAPSRDLFLVLDGRTARAFAASGAFGEEHGGGLQPVLKLVEDPEAVQAILKTAPKNAPA